MIPASYPGSLLRRVSEPYSTTAGHRAGRTAERRLCVVNVVCACGSFYAVELTKWLRCPPARCIHCHGDYRRERYAAQKFLTARACP